MTRRRALIPLAAAAIAAGVAGLAVAASEGEAPATTTTSARTATAVVARRDLVEREDVDGSLGYADERTATAQGAGRVTRLPAEGTVVVRGETLVEIDGRPVPLLFGSRPAWRRLEAGVDDGADVLALEQNLAALGYDAGGSLTVDEHFDFATRVALERWKRAAGLEATGTLDPDEAVFLPGARRIGEHAVELGVQVQPGAELMETTSTRRVVTVDLEASQQDLARRGASVRVTLPDGRAVDGTIASVGTVAEAADDGTGDAPGDETESEPTIEITIAIESAAGALDQAPVDVSLERSRTKGALTVPIRSLLALAGGGYAVEVVRAGATELVAVETGAFADGYVEVKGAGIRAGVRVVTAE